MSEKEWFDQPVIVTGIGKYITRSGDEVDVHEVKHCCKDECKTETCFAVKGTLFRKDQVALKKGKIKITMSFNIWHVSGRLMPDFINREHDIIGEYIM